MAIAIGVRGTFLAPAAALRVPGSRAASRGSVRAREIGIVDAMYTPSTRAARELYNSLLL